MTRAEYDAESLRLITGIQTSARAVRTAETVCDDAFYALRDAEKARDSARNAYAEANQALTFHLWRSPDA